MEVAKALMEEWISRWGVPLEIQSDNGPEFASGLMETLCEKLEVEKIRNALYDGKGRKIQQNDQRHDKFGGSDLKRWDENLNLLCFYYNKSELATGRRPVMPTVATWEARPEAKTAVEYVNDTMEKMRDVSRECLKTREEIRQ